MRIVFVAACVAIAASAVVVEQSPMQFPEVQASVAAEIELWSLAKIKGMVKSAGHKLAMKAGAFKKKMVQISKDMPGLSADDVFAMATNAAKLTGGVMKLAAGDIKGAGDVIAVGKAAYNGGKAKMAKYKANKKARTGKAQVGGAPGYFVQAVGGPKGGAGAATPANGGGKKAGAGAGGK